MGLRKVSPKGSKTSDKIRLPRSGSMKVLTEHLKFHTKTHRAYVHMTPQVDEIVRKSGVKEGMVLVSAMHITAGVYVNDNESGLIEDIDQWLEHLAPFRKNYKHHETGEDNGDSHLKALLIHHEVIVPVTAGELDLGTWQRVFYAEFDGQRDKRVIMKSNGRIVVSKLRTRSLWPRNTQDHDCLIESADPPPIACANSCFPPATSIRQSENACSILICPADKNVRRLS